MTLPDRAPPRKVGRAGLYGPFLLVAVIAIAWSAAWLWLAGEVGRRLDSAGHRGVALGWQARRIYGYPFRIDVDFDRPRLGEASGWGVAAPRLQAEAFIFAPDHWVFVATDGLAFNRPRGGPVRVGARVLRASLSDVTGEPPRISVEGLGLTFTPAPGADPFAIASAGEVHLHFRAIGADQGAAFVEADRMMAAGSGPLARLADGAPLTVVADGTFSQASGLRGPGWRSAVHAWSARGGVIAVRDLRVLAGGVALEASGGPLRIDANGAVEGSLTARFAPQGGPAPANPGRAPPPLPAASLTFGGGQVRLGSVVVSPAPRLF